MNTWRGRFVPVGAVVAVALGLGWPPIARVVEGQGPAVDTAHELAALFEEGAVVFGTLCVSCHDAAGGEGQAPALSGHPSMGARDHIVRQILRGNLDKGMPAFAGQLNDRQVAAVATYIRNAWENAHGVVHEADAKTVRDEAASRR